MRATVEQICAIVFMSCGVVTWLTTTILLLAWHEEAWWYFMFHMTSVGLVLIAVLLHAEDERLSRIRDEEA